MTIKR